MVWCVKCIFGHLFFIQTFVPFLLASCGKPFYIIFLTWRVKWLYGKQFLNGLLTTLSIDYTSIHTSLFDSLFFYIFYLITSPCDFDLFIVSEVSYICTMEFFLSFQLVCSKMYTKDQSRRWMHSEATNRRGPKFQNG